jgi:hypothetical protein
VLEDHFVGADGFAIGDLYEVEVAGKAAEVELEGEALNLLVALDRLALGVKDVDLAIAACRDSG